MDKKKIVFFAFQKEKMCFMHVLLNALDLHEKGVETKIVIEGASTLLIKELIEEDNKPLKKVMELKLIDSVCKACANQMGALEYIRDHTDLVLNGDMNGHPPMADYTKEGYEIIVL